MPFGIRPWHLIAIVIVALIIFGPARLPQLGKSLGSFFRDLKAGAKDMSSGFKEGMQESESPKTETTTLESGREKAPGSAEQPGASQSTSGKGAVAGNFCTSCGSPNPPQAQYCNACGRKIKNES
jgi:sec-independent protein translocase protein TatA